jgi:DNA-binding Lrp family transcriptional regulator
MSDNTKQPDLFTTNVAWVHLLRDFMRSGEAARIGGQGILVYLSIKTHVDFNNGKSFPSISTIAREAGISERQVMREIKKLEEKGHLTRQTTAGRHNTYTLQERVGIKAAGDPHAVAGFPYVPNQFQRVTDEIKTAVRAGDLSGSPSVKIEVTVNINNTANNNGDGTQLAVFDTSGISDSKLKAAYEKLVRNAIGQIADDSDLNK